MDISAALPTFVVTLREGVEAALVVGIVLAYLKQAGQTRWNAWVYAGVGVGIGASLLVGFLFNRLLVTLASSDRPSAPIVQQFLEAGFGLVAIGLLSWMLVWMTQQARSLKSEIQGAITSALAESTGAGWGVFSLVMIAVLREGFETVMFITAQFQAGWLPAIGAGVGLLGAVGIGILLFQLGVQINLRRFFQIMGIFLLLIVSGLVVGALYHLDHGLALLAHTHPAYAAWCPADRASCWLGSQVWDLSQVLPDRQFPGVLLKALFGYRQQLYLGQAIAYGLFLTTIGGLYLTSLSGWSWPPRSSSPTPSLPTPSSSESVSSESASSNSSTSPSA